ncbi:LysM peptidoglycan-binding domain-containing protein [Patescibacteria group bacterium]|nr:LysM peptidoglycan-binding domain-containing protein [Patescibacteria group bacterium]MBU1472828.1 LysM peptidoglycan-binding domain-containing protein [Patescibacteria group bacterium]MBU2460364.1 LysM peptidoglycan-binding domain-containing protein [Patescibacteria group bacterium]MBU2543884.1 LysM peptidoglycan-binding domain-containing protein [Patescibacteria group bacterium]
MWKSLKLRINSIDSFISMILGLAVVLVIGMLVFNYVNSRKQTASQKTAVEKQEETTASLPTNHVTLAGETLWSISEKYYKTGYNWPDIQKANALVNPDYIEVDQALIIPDVTPIMPQGQTSSAMTHLGNVQYTAKVGDTLWDIAGTQYGDNYRWTAIAETNNLANPDLIHAGNVLTLP